MSKHRKQHSGNHQALTAQSITDQSGSSFSPHSQARLAAAKAAAFLPRGYVGVSGHRAQDMFLRAVESYGEHMSAAASLLYDCAVANLTDPNRRGDAQRVIDDLKRQMAFLTGDTTLQAARRNIDVVSIGGGVDGVKSSEPEINVVE